MAPKDRVKQVRIAGVRSIPRATIDLPSLRVLYGGTGTGKSSIVQCFELLRIVGSAKQAVRVIAEEGHGLKDMMRHGTKTLDLGVTVESPDETYTYDISFGRVGFKGLGVVEERLYAGDQEVFDTKQGKYRGKVRSGETLLRRWHNENAACACVGNALRTIRSFGPFITAPPWHLHKLGVYDRGCRSMRQTAEPDLLDTVAHNLGPVLQSLCESAYKRERIMSQVREGLRRVLDLDFLAAAHGDMMAMTFRDYAGWPVLATQLSQGELSYLALVTLAELSGTRSCIAIDCPEGHLSPQLIRLLVTLLETVSADVPVLVTTQSMDLVETLNDLTCLRVLKPNDNMQELELRPITARQAQIIGARRELDHPFLPKRP